MLVAKRSLNDPNFGQTIVLLTFHAITGSTGLIINRPSEIALSAGAPALGKLAGDEATVHFGGPVDVSTIRLLVRTTKSFPNANPIVDDTYLVDGPSEIEQVLTDREQWAVDDVHYYVGYAGWSPGQLDREIERGDWYLVPGDPAVIFDGDTDGIWERLIELLDARWVSTENRAAADRS